jgi:hypothetical protein
MGFGGKAKRSQCNWHQIGLQEQARSRWHSGEKQGKASCTRIYSS